MKWNFENNGVNVTLASPYFAGSALEQAHAIARAGNFELYADTSEVPTVLAIWPKTGTRGGHVPIISAATGLVGYPRYQSNGMSFRCLYNPSIKLGGVIEMRSSVGGAPKTVPASDNRVPPGTQTGGPNGTWMVVSPMTHDLSAQVPGGPWFMSVNCVRISGPGKSA